MFCYSVFYWATKLDITKTVSMVLYMGYMALISLGFFLITGALRAFALESS